MKKLPLILSKTLAVVLLNVVLSPMVAFAFTNLNTSESGTDGGSWSTPSLSQVTAIGASTADQVRLSGGLIIADGSVSSPSLGFISDTDTGLHRISANQVGISAGGSDIMSVNATSINPYQQILTNGQNTPCSPDIGSRLSPQSGLGFYTSGTVAVYVYPCATAMWWRDDGVTEFSQELRPASDGLLDIGNSSRHVKTLWSQGVTTTHATTSDMLVTGAGGIQFSADSQSEIGSYLKRPSQIYSNVMNVETITASGTSLELGVNHGNGRVFLYDDGNGRRSFIPEDTVYLGDTTGTGAYWRGLAVVDSTSTGDVYMMGIPTTTAGVLGSLCIDVHGRVSKNNSTTCLLSAAKFKHAITVLKDGALSLIMGLTPSTAIYNGTKNEKVTLIADVVCKLDERLCVRDGNGDVVSYDPFGVLTYVVKGMQELVFKTNEMQDHINELENRINKIEKINQMCSIK